MNLQKELRHKSEDIDEAVERQIEEEKLVRIPRTLDLTPYRDEMDFGLLERLVRKEKSK